MTVVTDENSAFAALNTIVNQGEGNIDEAEEGVKGKQKRKHATRDDVRAQRKTTDEAPVRVVVEDKLQKRKAAGGTEYVKSPIEFTRAQRAHCLPPPC